MTSLRRRLGFGMLLSLAAMITAVWVTVGISVRGLVEDQVASRLEHDGEALLGGMQVDAEGNISLDAARVQGIYRQPFSGHYYLIDAGGGILRSRSLWDQSLNVPRVAVGETQLTYITGPQQQPLLVWTRGFRKQGVLVQLSVAEDLLTMREGARRFQWRLLAWSLALVLIVLLVQQYIVARSLRPVQAATDDVARLERGEISQLDERVPDEVRPLVQAINTLLQRQQQRLTRSREAIGNLAHAIKTPLTLVQQIAADAAGPGNREACERLSAYSRQIQERVDQSLRRARLAGDSVGTGRFDTVRDLTVLVDTLDRLNRDRHIEYRQQLDVSGSLPLEQQDGMELLGNLLDNAWKWARSTVQLSIRDAGATLLISIEDDGPGVERSRQQSLLQRGVRHDESTPGHGIGLSIVKSLLDEIGGSISFGRSATLGGLRVEVSLHK